MEATTTLADALLDDLDDLMESDDEGQNDDSPNKNAEAFIKEEDDDHLNGNGLVSSNMTKSSSTTGSDTGTSYVVSQFLHNPSLVKHTKIIGEHIESYDSTGKNSDKKAPSSIEVSSRKQREEENHQLVVQSNKYLASLQEELERAHGQLATAYNPKFPELEELLPNHLHYKNAVRIIGNESDLTKVNDELNEILTSNQIITISMAGSTTSGRTLTEAELQMVDASATYMENLLSVQNTLMKFVENSMEFLCPSICALIGAPTAARLLGLAGGLQELTNVSRHVEGKTHMHKCDCT